MNEQVNYAKIQRIQDDLDSLVIGQFGTGFVTDAMLYESGIKNTVASHTSQLEQSKTLTLNVLKPPSGYSAAVGDGTTNDSSNIQTLINLVNTNGGGTIVLPYTANGYKLSTTLTIPSNVTIVGFNTKIIKPSNTIADTIFNLSGVSGVKIEGFYCVSTFDKTKYDGRNGLSSNIHCFSISNSSNINISKFKVENMEYFVKCNTNVQKLQVRDSECINTHQPIFTDTTTNSEFSNLKLSCPSSANTDVLDHHFYIANYSDDIKINNCYMTGGAGYAIILNDSSTPTPFEPKNIYLNNLIFKDVIRTIYSSADNVIAKGIIIDGTNGDYIINVNLGNFYMSDFILKNIISTSTIFYTTLTAVSTFANGYVYDGTSVLFANLAGNPCVFDNVYFKGQSGSSSASFYNNTAFGNFIVQNCIFIDTEAPPNRMFSIRGTGTGIIKGNVFTNSLAGSQSICYNLSPAVVIVQDNIYSGWADIILIGFDTGSIDVGNTTMTTNKKITRSVFENAKAGDGIILKTPDGTKRYKITIDNSGVVTSTIQ